MIVSNVLNQGKFPVIEKDTQPQVAAYLSFTGLEQIGQQIWAVRDWIKQQGFTESGAPACIFHCSTDNNCLDPANTDCEIFWPVAEQPAGLVNDCPPPKNQIHLQIIGARHVLSTYHQGDTETIDETFDVLRSVVKQYQYQVTGYPHEIYLFDVCEPKSRWITEAQIPIQPKN